MHTWGKTIWRLFSPFSHFLYIFSPYIQSPGPIPDLHDENAGSPLFTMLGLMQAIQKLPKSPAFPLMKAKLSSQISNSSTEAPKFFMKIVNGGEGKGGGLSMESYEAMRTALNPREPDKNNVLVMQNIAASLDDTDARNQSDGEDTALRWVS